MVKLRTPSTHPINHSLSPSLSPSPTQLLQEMEITLSATKEQVAQAASQSSSDQEVIGFLDSRAQELEVGATVCVHVHCVFTQDLNFIG